MYVYVLYIHVAYRYSLYSYLIWNLNPKAKGWFNSISWETALWRTLSSPRHAWIRPAPALMYFPPIWHPPLLLPRSRTSLFSLCCAAFIGGNTSSALLRINNTAHWKYMFHACLGRWRKHQQLPVPPAVPHQLSDFLLPILRDSLTGAAPLSDWQKWHPTRSTLCSVLCGSRH